MRMKTEHYQRLWDMSNVNGRTLRMDLILSRRVCREVLAELEHFGAPYRKKIAELSKGLPFTAARLADVQEAYRDFTENQRGILRSIGSWLAHSPRDMVKHLPFEEVAAIYAVNRVHWHEARPEYEEHGLMGLLHIGKYEDSSIYLAKADKTGFFFDMGPTCEAVNHHMVKWMAENIDKLPSPFEPGSPLYGVPTYTVQPDGSMQRNAPSLVVHNRDGSTAVIDRKDGR
ncbi:hypothetical protein [Pseudomonas sp. UBA6323]|uniref:hypothetical protein n=1 Tax=Pseudomonas sp. UBA6323 TaxID=1947329 RepID=UPI0025DA600F|nr:hypothetical protein [Pseudomonas sp. UBA6323]